MKFGRQLPTELHELQMEIEGYAKEFGLDYFPTIFEVLDYDQINQVAAYGGFPVRYPHWRFGMDYERLAKGYTYGLQKIYEMVINNNPCYAYLLESNSYVEQKTVMAHVLAHCDFFKHNEFFKHTNRRMIDEMANHAIRIRRYIDRYGIEEIEEFIDTCLSLDNLIDYYTPYFEDMDISEKDDPMDMEVPRFKGHKDYMEEFINPSSYIEEQREKIAKIQKQQKRFPPRPVKDVMWFLVQHAPLNHWQRDILSIIREEAYYFAPQGQTKIMNEGWACLAPESLAFTNQGVRTMREVLCEEIPMISDGQTTRTIYDRHTIPDHPTIEIKTKRGFTLCGSNNHRLLLPDGETWKRLDAFETGDRVAISGGAGLWATAQVSLSWPEVHELTSTSGAGQTAGNGGPSRRALSRHYASAAPAMAEARAIAVDDEEIRSLEVPQDRVALKLPAQLDESLGALLGCLVGAGGLRTTRRVELLTEDESLAVRFLELAQACFGLTASLARDDHGWRVALHSERACGFFKEVLGLCLDTESHTQKIPAAILRSPAPVIRSFLRGCFDCGGRVSGQEVCFLTASEVLSEQLQLLLLNDGLLSSRRHVDGEGWEVVVSEQMALFAAQIGFGVQREREALALLLEEHGDELEVDWSDEIVSIEHGRGDVYDISVEETHRYAAQGFVNHNSYWHSKIMTERAAKDSEIIDFASSHAGVVASSRTQLNPYKLGLELFRHIEERWDKGRFGKEFSDCDDLYLRANWDLKLGLGREKIFQVRRIYNDVTFIDEFMTEEFCREHKMFGFDFNRSTGRYEISSREFKDIKEKLLFQLTNFGQPFIRVVDANFENRSELLLGHRHEGVDLRVDYGRAVLENLFKVWKRPVNISTRVEKKGRLFCFDGKEHTIREFDYIEIRD